MWFLTTDLNFYFGINFHCLKQRLANYGPLLVFENKFYSNITMPIHLFNVYGYFHDTNELSSRNRDHMSNKNTYSLASAERFATLV